MFQQLKKYTAQKKVAQGLASHRPVSIKSLQKVIILTTEKYIEFLEISRLASALEIEEKQLSIFVFSKEDKTAENSKVLFSTKKEFGWNGKLKEESNAKKVQAENYDLLIHYFEEAPQELLLLSALTQAKLKVGFPVIENNLNDLDIAAKPKESEVFIKELKKYLSVINL
ncbi:DUF6913 domain-containing protein [Mesonia maritima]|uniref:Uncharacterized protein n=1 Tax=Mesonia maritima TaxID=1793873 RepID=A0ABU1K4Z5_9FLAO|nr:hypothetical protein [Mesonia maritima]MDR6300325.1 hypothetical protein [Mesonia maritima]